MGVVYGIFPFAGDERDVRSAFFFVGDESGVGVRGGGSSSSSSIQKSLWCLDLGVDGPGSLSRRRLTGDKVGDFATKLSKASIADPEVRACLGVDGPAMLSCTGVEIPGRV